MSIIAFDLGASGGKAFIGDLADSKLVIKEIHRFTNDPVQVGTHLYWDILRLFHEIKQGLIHSRLKGYHLESMAIDSWAVDFGLIGKGGQLLSNPFHYRNRHTEGMMEKVSEIISEDELFSRTGIQFLPFNTIYQLYALRQDDNSVLKHAESMLMIPDLLRYFLTGEKLSEFTNASTSQLMNHKTRTWDDFLLKKLGLPSHIFLEPVKPGTFAGNLLPTICEELSLPKISVIAVGEHDTASAVVAVPADSDDFAYLSCGTWSLLGTEVSAPVLSKKAKELNFTNEGGIDTTYRLLKNIMGLWIIQECKRTWAKEGVIITYEELIKEAEKAQPFQFLIDPDHVMFLHPSHMPNQINAYCQETKQSSPQNKGEYIRCVLESLALKYLVVLQYTEELSGKNFKGLHMVGGGIQNEMLCQFTANAIGRPVWAGPIEASAIGNLMTQFIALNKVENIQEARRIIRQSFSIKTYEPQEINEWKRVYSKFKSLIHH